MSPPARLHTANALHWALLGGALARLAWERAQDVLLHAPLKLWHEPLDIDAATEAVLRARLCVAPQ
jgi:hypothetical protein